MDTITVVMSCLQTNGGSIAGRPRCSILKSYADTVAIYIYKDMHGELVIER